MENNELNQNSESVSQVPFVDPETVSVNYTIISPIGTLRKKLSRFDTRISVFMQLQMRYAWLDRIMRYLSYSADGYLYFVFGAMVMYADLEIGLEFSYIVLTAFAVQIPVQKGIKHIFRRSRPYSLGNGINKFIAPPDKYSFPSGHTAGAVIMAVLVPSVLGSEMVGVLAALTLALWAISVGISRIYNGVHYTSDVIAGALLGAASSVAALQIHGVW